MVRARERFLAKYPDLKDSPFNTPERKKFVLSGKVNGNDLDVVLAPNDQAMKYIESVRKASSSLTPEEKAKIREEKARLKKSLLFSDKRYKRYKSKLDKDLEIAKF